MNMLLYVAKTKRNNEQLKTKFISIKIRKSLVQWLKHVDSNSLRLLTIMNTI